MKYIVSTFRKSFLNNVDIAAGSAEHKAFVSEYYKGNDGNISQTNLTGVDSKLTAAKLLGNYSFYAAAAQQCDKVRCLLVTLLNKIA